MAAGTDPARGLTSSEAAARLAADGPNELPQEKRSTWLATLFDVVREPMLLLLLAAGGLYLLLGDVREAATLLFFVLVVIGITLVQERKTARAVEALRDLSSPRALVVRDGARVRIAGREVVRGDLVVLAEGDRVPADGWLAAATNLAVDESMLTGESVPVRKRAGEATAADPPGGDDSPRVFSGTLVVRGHGLCEVQATGTRTEMGRIGRALAEAPRDRTPLEREVATMVRTIALGGLSLCALLVAVYGAVRGEWLQGLLAGIALAMAVLPEELPVVLTVFLALGAYRISRRGVLTRRTSAIEALGAATVLCTDKTGTLTKNRMRLARLFVADGTLHDPGEGPLPEAVHELVEIGILASRPSPSDPMELAFHALGDAGLAGTEHLHRTWQLAREYPLSPALLSVAHAWRAPDDERWILAAKGAPEAIFDLCHLPIEASEPLSAEARRMADDGLRVLGVAEARVAGPLPAEQHDAPFRFVGLVGLADPIREAVPAAVRECREAGVRVVMITGDYPETARAIARQAGIEPALVTGAEIDALGDAELAARLAHVGVVARAVPEHKLRIVRALRAAGEIVAMTGDGVNDAPALEAADVGIAMGGRGTDVAREAAALVVTDDDFASIVSALRLGRRIHDNLRQAMAYVLAVHVPIAGLALLPTLLGWPLVLHPVHIVFLELIIDPACSIAFEAEPPAPDVMRRPPRPPRERLVPGRVVVTSVLQGASVLAVALAAFHLAAGAGLAEPESRAIAFVALVAGNLGLILVNRSRTRTVLASLATRNLAAWIVIGAASALLAATIALPPLRSLFAFGVPELRWLAAAALAGVASLAWVELGKAWRPPAG